jgi:2-polyprenyl-6-methoxyphenol hydroxylase-like FAD-dependent oxidoreductase
MSLLVVQAGRVRRWHRPGLLLIGDAAHVMSPVFGVGINYAVQDAVVASNALGPRLLAGGIRSGDLAEVQRRRELPTRLMQWMQTFGEHESAAARRTGRRQLEGWLLNLPPMQHLRARLIAFGAWTPERIAQEPPALEDWWPLVVPMTPFGYPWPLPALLARRASEHPASRVPVERGS